MLLYESPSYSLNGSINIEIKYLLETKCSNKFDIMDLNVLEPYLKIMFPHQNFSVSF